MSRGRHRDGTGSQPVFDPGVFRSAGIPVPGLGQKSNPNADPDLECTKIPNLRDPKNLKSPMFF